jgi:hypothetical protein
VFIVDDGRAVSADITPHAPHCATPACWCWSGRGQVSLGLTGVGLVFLQLFAVNHVHAVIFNEKIAHYVDLKGRLTKLDLAKSGMVRKALLGTCNTGQL